MKFLLSFAAVIAVAVAVPTQRGLVTPEGAGPVPAPIVFPEGAGPVPAPIPGLEPIAIGPADIAVEPVAIGPAIVEPAEESIPSTPLFPATPVVQIIVNVNSAGAVVGEPVVISPSPAVVDPVQVVDAAPEPVEPVVIGTPVLPAPVITLPEMLN